MLRLWAFGRIRVSSVSNRSQTAARENQTVLHCLQHTGEPDRHFRCQISRGLNLKYKTIFSCYFIYFFNFKVHTHSSRQGHSPKPLAVPAEVSSDNPVPRHTMQLFAVLCIQTSHYVSFVKYGLNPHSWLFFDSMADRCGKKDFSLSYLFESIGCFLAWVRSLNGIIALSNNLIDVCVNCEASTVLDKATLWRLWLVFISSWADV